MHSLLTFSDRRMHQGVALSTDSTAGWFRRLHDSARKPQSLESLRSSFSPDARARPLARTTSDDMARGSLTTNWRIGGRSWKAPGRQAAPCGAPRTQVGGSGRARTGGWECRDRDRATKGHPPRANSTPSTMNAVLRLLKVG